MSKVLAVFGATGTQGGSVVHNVLNDPELSKAYKIRAITRDVNADKARQLSAKVEVVQADVLDRSSLEAALTGVHTVFSVTVPDFGPNAVEVEYKNATQIADVAVAKGVEYFIFSTLPSPAKISNGKHTKVTAFDAKAQAEEYIRKLNIKSAFVSLGWFMENFHTQPFMAPQPNPDGTWGLYRNVSPQVKWPMLFASEDVGKFVGAILAQPEKYEGTTWCCAQAEYTLEEIAAIFTKATGKTVVNKHISDQEMLGRVSFVPELFVDALNFTEGFGYFGPGQAEAVRWAATNARGRLSTLEDYLKVKPLQLQE
jgi:uncharacterized protein YbjT (DUF2867 family)